MAALGSSRKFVRCIPNAISPEMDEGPIKALWAGSGEKTFQFGRAFFRVDRAKEGHGGAVSARRRENRNLGGLYDV